MADTELPQAQRRAILTLRLDQRSGHGVQAGGRQMDDGEKEAESITRQQCRVGT
jgi:hypothetical protein